MNILVLGPGCPKCTETEKIVNTALQEAGVEASMNKVSDFQEIAKLGVFSTPAVVIDGKIKCVGKVPDKSEVIYWLNL
ncbi:MAG: thioredoxin family protein [Desulfobacterales bacterium]|nr:thioredoxin family protein [Desulfobacterales bacterium]